MKRIFETKSRKFIDLSRIEAITECQVTQVQGWPNGCYGFFVFLELIENPIHVHRGGFDSLEKRDEIDFERTELISKWEEFLNDR